MFSLCHFVLLLLSIFEHENLHCGKPGALLWVQIGRLFLAWLVIKCWERGEQLSRLDLSPQARFPKLHKVPCGRSEMRAITLQTAGSKVFFVSHFMFYLFCSDK